MGGLKQQVSVLAVLEVAFRQCVNLFLWPGDSQIQAVPEATGIGGHRVLRQMQILDVMPRQKCIIDMTQPGLVPKPFISPRTCSARSETSLSAKKMAEP